MVRTLAAVRAADRSEAAPVVAEVIIVGFNEALTVNVELWVLAVPAAVEATIMALEAAAAVAAGMAVVVAVRDPGVPAAAAVAVAVAADRRTSSRARPC
jgi:hypothetical protein